MVRRRVEGLLWCFCCAMRRRACEEVTAGRGANGLSPPGYGGKKTRRVTARIRRSSAGHRVLHDERGKLMDPGNKRGRTRQELRTTHHNTQHSTCPCLLAVPRYWQSPSVSPECGSLPRFCIFCSANTEAYSCYVGGHFRPSQDAPLQQATGSRVRTKQFTCLRGYLLGRRTCRCFPPHRVLAQNQVVRLLASADGYNTLTIPRKQFCAQGLQCRCIV